MSDPNPFMITKEAEERFYAKHYKSPDVYDAIKSSPFDSLRVSESTLVNCLNDLYESLYNMNYRGIHFDVHIDGNKNIYFELSHGGVRRVLKIPDDPKQRFSITPEESRARSNPIKEDKVSTTVFLEEFCGEGK